MQGVNITVDDYYYIKAWIGYLDITIGDVFLFLAFCLLIALGVYVFLKKNLFLGFLQVMLTLFTPCVVGGFFMSWKPFWDVEKKMWMKLFFSNHVQSDIPNAVISILALLVLIFVPALIIISLINMTLLKKSENSI